MRTLTVTLCTAVVLITCLTQVDSWLLSRRNPIPTCPGHVGRAKRGVSHAFLTKHVLGNVNDLHNKLFDLYHQGYFDDRRTQHTFIIGTQNDVRNTINNFGRARNWTTERYTLPVQDMVHVTLTWAYGTLVGAFGQDVHRGSGTVDIAVCTPQDNTEPIVVHLDNARILHYQY